MLNQLNLKRCKVFHYKNGTQLSAPRIKGLKRKWSFIATLQTLSTTSNETRQQSPSNSLA